MAEAMLEDEYKSSHQNLEEWGEQQQRREQHQQQQQQQQQLEEQDGNKESGVFQKYQSSSFKSLRSFGSSMSMGRKSETRSVAIQLPSQPPTKKLKMHSTSEEIIKALNTSVSAKERMDAIHMALSTLDHGVQTLHDQEIEAGMDIALTKHLVLLEFQAGFRRTPYRADLAEINRETSLTCEALEYVLGASSGQVAKAFHRIGTSLLQVIATILEQEITIRIQALSLDVPSDTEVNVDLSSQQLHNGNGKTNDGTIQEGDITKTSDNSRSVTPPLPERKYSMDSVGSYDRDMMLDRVTKILGHFARVGEATKPLAHFPGLLGNLLNLINIQPYEAVPWQARLSCLWVIANLACNTDNMQMMICTPTLVNSLVNIGARKLNSPESLQTTMEILRSRSIVSRAIMNLSWMPENKVSLSTNVALLQQLSKFAVLRTHPFARSKTIQDIVLQTRRHSVSAIRNLAAASHRTKIALCQFENGKLLEVLTDVALNDDDQNLKDLTFSAIHNLAIQDTATLMIERPSLVMALKNQLLAEEESKGPESNHKSDSSSTLLVLERSITPEMNSYENLKSLLDTVNSSPVPTESDSEELDTVAV